MNSLTIWRTIVISVVIAGVGLISLFLLVRDDDTEPEDVGAACAQLDALGVPDRWMASTGALTVDREQAQRVVVAIRIGRSFPTASQDARWEQLAEILELGSSEPTTALTAADRSTTAWVERWARERCGSPTGG